MLQEAKQKDTLTSDETVYSFISENIKIITNTFDNDDSDDLFIHSTFSKILYFIFSIFGYQNVYECIFYLRAKHLYILLLNKKYTHKIWFYKYIVTKITPKIEKK